MKHKLILFAIGIYVVYLTQGIVLEKLHSQDFDGEKWEFPDGVLLFTLTGNIVVAGTMMWLRSPAPNRVEQKYFAMMAFPVFMAAGLTFTAMSRVDYPTVSLFKSAKPLAVLGVAFLARQHHVYSFRQKVMVAFVSVGLVLFFFSKEGFDLEGDTQDGFSWSSRLLGYGCLFGSLTLDGCSSLVGSYLVHHATPPSQFHIQLYVASWSMSVVSVYVMLSGRIGEIVNFLVNHPDALMLGLQLSVLSGIGHLFVFGTMTTFNPLVLSIVTTSRKMCTIVLSSLVFDHSLKTLQWLAVCVLFVGLLWKDVWDYVKERLSSSMMAEEKEKEPGVVV